MDPIPEIPIDPAALSRDPAVGEAYAHDELVYHGPFKRATLEAFFAASTASRRAARSATCRRCGSTATDDQLVPLELTRPAIEHVRGSDFTERIYQGARHEVFNETNRDAVLEDVSAFLREALAQPLRRDLRSDVLDRAGR